MKDRHEAKRRSSVWSIPSGFDMSDATRLEEEALGVVLPSKMLPFLLSIISWGLLIVYTGVILLGDVCLLPRDDSVWCRAAKEGYPIVKDYPNPDANTNPCHYERTLYLLFMNQFECMFSKRMIISVLLGAAIGWERKAADRPAGVRTMSLVSLGSCFFTMCGQHAFRSSPQEFDAARVSAAIPSGVGFLGSALIWKHSTGAANEVHGLTTAASVWLSASVGIGCGGGLFILSAYCVVLVIFVLRIGPGMFFLHDSESFGAEDDEEESQTEDDWDDFPTTADGVDEPEHPPEPHEAATMRSPRGQLLKQQASSRSIPQTSLRSTQRQKSRASLIQPTFSS